MAEVDFRIPADASDKEHLDNTRATVWPGVWALVIVIVAIFVAGGIILGWLTAVIIALVCFIIGMAVLVGYGNRNNMSEEEVKLAEESLPGHDVFKKEDVRVTSGKSYDLDCAPSDIYPYLAQMNLVKAGFYSFQHFERFFGFHIRNDYTIRPEWQELHVGDWMYYHQNGAGTGIYDFKENEYIVTYSDTRYKPTQDLAIAWTPKWMPKGFAWTWNFIFVPDATSEKTHFISTLQAWWPEDTPKGTITRMMVQWGLPSNFMMNGMASKMKKLAEEDAAARRAGKPRPGYTGER